MWNFHVFVNSSISSRKGCRISPCGLHFKGKTAGTSPRTNTSHTSPSPPPRSKAPISLLQVSVLLTFWAQKWTWRIVPNRCISGFSQGWWGQARGRVEMSNCERGTKNHNLYQSFHTICQGGVHISPKKLRASELFLIYGIAALAAFAPKSSMLFFSKWKTMKMPHDPKQHEMCVFFRNGRFSFFPFFRQEIPPVQPSMMDQAAPSQMPLATEDRFSYRGDSRYHIHNAWEPTKIWFFRVTWGHFCIPKTLAYMYICIMCIICIIYVLYVLYVSYSLYVLYVLFL